MIAWLLWGCVFAVGTVVGMWLIGPASYRVPCMRVAALFMIAGATFALCIRWTTT